MSTNSPKLSVFLCHASQDKPAVRELYQRLLAENWIEPWLDEEKLLPGQDWDLEIEKAVESSDVVVVFVSGRSVTKEGYVQKELRKVLDIALEKPEETIFIIPLRLEACELPRRLRPLHYVDYFPAEQQERAYQRLLQSLKIRFLQLQPVTSPQEVSSGIDVDRVRNSSAILPTEKAIHQPVKEALQVDAGGNLDTGSVILLMIYFAMAAFDSFASSSDTIETLLAISAILAGFAVLRGKTIPPGVIFKISLITYLLIYGFGYRLTNSIPAFFYVAGAAAVVAGIMLVISARMPGRHVLYSAIAFASFLFLVTAYELLTNFVSSNFASILDTLILVMSIITSVLLWRDF